MIQNMLQVKKNGTVQGDDCTIGYLLDYPYFKENYKLIKVDLRNQQALDSDREAVKQIHFTGNLEQAGNTTMFFILEKVKESILDCKFI